MSTGETLSEMVQRVCGRSLDELASTEELSGFREASAALACFGDEDATMDDSPQLCHACEFPAPFKCPCGNAICGAHSYDTFGQRTRFGICSKCVDEMNPPDPVGDMYRDSGVRNS